MSLSATALPELDSFLLPLTSFHSPEEPHHGMNKSELVCLNLICRTLLRVHGDHLVASDHMLELWGLRSSGGTLQGPMKPDRSGGEPGTDIGMATVRYVESCSGFSEAHEALRWVFVLGRRSQDFPLVGPGETLSRALLRRGWGFCLGIGRRDICGAVVAMFQQTLIDCLVTRPFDPHPPVGIRVEATAEQVAAAASAVAERKYPTANR